MKYPFLFDFRDKVFGKGFLADIRARGRVLGELEGKGASRRAWLYGVTPGGLAAAGENEREAYMNFRRAFFNVLEDVAEEAAGFEDFRAGARAFFSESCAETQVLWSRAVEDVRSGKIRLKDMPRRSADSPARVVITRVALEKIGPKENAKETLIDPPTALIAA